MNTVSILLVTGIYLFLLFSVAYLVDGQSKRGILGKLPKEWIYALSIAVYCTSWTFYGSVGRSANTGYGFLPIYIGPALVFLFAQPFLNKLLAISKAQHITSIADLIAARYGKRQSLAGLVTCIAVIGIVPYISLQLKAISSTFQLLGNTTHGDGSVLLHQDTALYVTLALGVFVLVFGTRRVDATEQHTGLMAAVALESALKLGAFLVVGIFITYGLHNGFADIIGHAAQTPRLRDLIGPGSSFGTVDFWVLSFLSGLVIFCLPRQFQVTIVENTEPAHLRKAAWVFPLYLVAINIFVLPIALAGLLHIGKPGNSPDFFVLTLPLDAGYSGIGLVAFVGGLAASTGMIIVETIALSTMISNDLVLPLLIRGKFLNEEGKESFVGLVKRTRRVSILIILLLAFAYVRLIGDSYTLVSIGLLSFVAVAQFAPAIIGGLYWERGNAIGAFAGLALGFIVWTYTLLIPSFAESGWIAHDFIENGPLGIALLRPYHLFGWSGLDYISQGLFWSLLVNIGAYLAASFCFTQQEDEQIQARIFVNVHKSGQRISRSIAQGLYWSDLSHLLSLFVGTHRAQCALANYAEEHKLIAAPENKADTDLLNHVEKVLAGSVGSSLARVVVAATAKERHDRMETMRLLSNASEQIEIQWSRLREAVDNIDQGISMFDADLKLQVWNQRYLELLDFPDSFGAVDTPLEKFFRYNAERGEYGPGDIDKLVEDRVALARLGEAHIFERRRGNGTIVEISGKPLPQGGFITTYTDITERKRNEIALYEAKNELEQRVEARTRALKESEERFRDFAESSSDWMWETNADLRFCYFSERAAELLGRPIETLLGQTREELATGQERIKAPEKWQQHLDDMAAHRPFRDFDYPILRDDGTLNVIRVNGKPIFDATGQFCGYRGTGADVTDLTQAQSELLEVEKLAALGRLVAGVAHEINTPVGIGITAASYLQEQTHHFTTLYSNGQVKRSDMQSYLRAATEAGDSIVTNLRRAATLVQSFKQVAVDQTSEQRRRFNLKEYLEEILESLRPELKRTEHQVEVACSKDIELDSYPGAFSQIITNLVINALLHGFEKTAAGWIHIDIQRDDKDISLIYSDNGCGMSAAHAKRIFEPFFTTRLGQGGSGLGMHVVYNLVIQTLNGKIECKTAPGAGVQFLITIPINS